MVGTCEAGGRLLVLPASVVDDADDLDGVHEVQVAQLAPGRFEVRMVPRAGAELAPVRDQVLRNVEEFFGSGQTTTFVVTDQIPRTASGKLKTAVLDPVEVPAPLDPSKQVPDQA